MFQKRGIPRRQTIDALSTVPRAGDEAVHGDTQSHHTCSLAIQHDLLPHNWRFLHCSFLYIRPHLFFQTTPPVGQLPAPPQIAFTRAMTGLESITIRYRPRAEQFLHRRGESLVVDIRPQEIYSSGVNISTFQEAPDNNEQSTNNKTDRAYGSGN